MEKEGVAWLHFQRNGNQRARLLQLYSYMHLICNQPKAILFPGLGPAVGHGHWTTATAGEILQQAAGNNQNQTFTQLRVNQAGDEGRPSRGECQPLLEADFSRPNWGEQPFGEGDPPSSPSN